MVMQNCGGGNKVHYGLCENGEYSYIKKHSDKKNKKSLAKTVS